MSLSSLFLVCSVYLLPVTFASSSAGVSFSGSVVLCDDVGVLSSWKLPILLSMSAVGMSIDPLGSAFPSEC